MEFLSLFGLGFGTSLAGAMIPGPLMLYTISEAFRHGHRVGVKIAVGHLLLEAGFVALLVIGLHDLLVSVAFRTAVAWVGGIGLILMGVVLLARVRRLSLARRAQVSFRWGPLLGGVAFSLTSPGFLLWWATIGTSVVLQGALAGASGVAAVVTGHALADLLWCWFVAYSVDRGRCYCTDRAYRLIMAGVALGLMSLGVSFPLSLPEIR